MNAEEVQSRYASLRQAQEKGSITDDQFQNDVAQLRLQGPDGFWYQINPSDGGWLKWNGQTWEKAIMPATPTVQQPVPRKFFPLLLFILKSAFRAFRQQLPMMVLFGILGWLLHTYLLVHVNQGYNLDTDSPFISRFLTAVPKDVKGILNQNTVSGTIIWMVVSGILFSWVNSVINRLRGKQAAKAPKRPSLRSSFREAGMLALASILAAAGLSLIIGLAMNGYGSLVLAVGVGGFLLSKGGSVVSLLISSAWSSTYGLAQSQKTRELSASIGQVAMVGSILGFLLNSCMPNTVNNTDHSFMTVKAILGAVMLIGAFVVTRRQGQSVAVTLRSILPLLLFLGVIIYLYNALPAFADDGGDAEASGGFLGYLGSEGAAKALVMGIGPGVGAMIGPAVGQGLSGAAASGLIDWDSLSGDGNTITETPPGPDAKPPDETETEETIYDEQGNPMTRWEAGYAPGENGYAGKKGDVWDGKNWISPQEALKKIEQQENKKKQEEKEKQEKQEREWRERNQRLEEENRREREREYQEAAKRRAEEQQREKLEQQRTERMINNLKRDKDLSDQVDKLVANGDYDKVNQLYRDKCNGMIKTGAKDAKEWQEWAQFHDLGAKTAQLTVTASKAALMTIGGPAGFATTATLVGAVSGAAEGAESYVGGDPIRKVVAHTAAGFLSGVKDTAIGTYTNMPGVGKTAKYIVPAGAETVETYIRGIVDNPDNESHSAILTKALKSGALSIVSDFAGNKIDGIRSGALREIGKLGAAGASGGGASVIQGGTFGEGFQQGVESAAAGRIGGIAAGKYADYKVRTPEETAVQKAIDEMKKQSKQAIPMKDQAEITQNLDKTRYVQKGKLYVDEKLTLQQLTDTMSSRTAKQASGVTQQAITNTRQDKIYGPADKVTIATTTQKLKAAGLLKEGDKLEMDTFSTPGKGGVSLGADRDARLVIESTDPSSGKKVKIEVPAKYWEDDAYKDFYEHTMKMTGGEGAIPAETRKIYDLAKEDLQYLKKAGYTDEQINHRAWAQAHNQLFTTKAHMEASRDNADQTTKFVEGKLVATQKTSHIVETQAGKESLLDPGGYSRMWEEKSRIYERMGNKPEAIAQCQKGIEQYMKTRDGYHAQGYEVPPIDDNTAKAMQIIAKAPVGVRADSDAMARVDEELQKLNFKNTYDALGKIATQNEVLKWSQPRPELGSGMTSRLGREDVYRDNQR